MIKGNAVTLIKTAKNESKNIEEMSELLLDSKDSINSPMMINVKIYIGKSGDGDDKN